MLIFSTLPGEMWIEQAPQSEGVHKLIMKSL